VWVLLLCSWRRSAVGAGLQSVQVSLTRSSATDLDLCVTLFREPGMIEDLPQSKAFHRIGTQETGQEVDDICG
jgi:hypothetical protein